MSTQLNNRLVAVIGGTGFIGSHLIDALASRRLPTRVFGRTLERPYLTELRQGVELIAGDVGSRSDVALALAGATDVVYLAQSTVPATSMGDLQYDLASNVLPFISFLEQLGKSPTARRLIYISSGGTVYGNPREAQPFVEDDPTRPVSSYGLTKLVCEHYVRLILGASPIASYILRPSNAYGERQDLTRRQGAVGIFLKALHEREPITLYGGGAVVRDYVYVGDVVDAILSCLDDAEFRPKPTIYNVGSSRGLSLLQLVRCIEDVSGESFTIHNAPARPFDCTFSVLDINAIQSDLGWNPRVSLNEGIARTWAWIRSLPGTVHGADDHPTPRDAAPDRASS